MRKFIAAVFFGFALVGVCREANAYCSEPSAPHCATSYGAFGGQSDFQNCRSEMGRYQSDVEEFTECNRKDAQEAIDKAKRDNGDALTTYNDAVNSFNRRANSR